MIIVKLYEKHGFFKWLEFDEKYYTFEEVYNFAFRLIPREYRSADIITAEKKTHIGYCEL